MTKADSHHRRAINAGVEGNERLTAVTSAVLLAFILIALATTPNLRALLYVHVFVGILLIGPLAVKLGSTGYRFARYYTGAPAYVAKGPPHLALRIVAPALSISVTRMSNARLPRRSGFPRAGRGSRVRS